METINKVSRLVQFATGEEYGDGEMVTNIGVGISEPGYGDSDTVWALGNWNQKRWIRDGDAPLTKEESLPARLAESLERVGAEVHWLDEWETCIECYQIFRTTGDSYSWTMYGIWTEDGGVCANCVTFDDLEDKINDAQFALTFELDLEAEGFEAYNGTFESGWHEGQNDNPVDLLAKAQGEGWAEGIFKIGSVGQFDVRFTLWVRGNDEGDEE